MVNKASEAVLLESRIGLCQLAVDLSTCNVSTMKEEKFIKTVNALAEHQASMSKNLWIAITVKFGKMDFESCITEALQDPEAALTKLLDVLPGLCFWDSSLTASKFSVASPKFLELLPALCAPLAGAAGGSGAGEDKDSAFLEVFADDTSRQPDDLSVAEQQALVKAGRCYCCLIWYLVVWQ